MVKCSNSKCKYELPPNYFTVYLGPDLKLTKSSSPQYEKYDKILECVMKTELFCINCSMKHTNVIFTNSNITKRDYFSGY